ncbi:hypothetical protein [Saccharothrix xinjiangensis]|uniref:Uncharacterized protein n=1 Tax=Saccharothrix xinjiangensis TaxID=204798 RepID=A0ABV9YCB9_9PSEU
MSVVSGAEGQILKFGQRTFPVPRLPVIRVWALTEHYPQPPQVSSYPSSGQCFKVAPNTPSAFDFGIHEENPGAWTTLTRTDFVVLRNGTQENPVEGWIHISPRSGEASKYSVYVHDDGKNVETVFGKYKGDKVKPEAFPDGGDNYFCEMADYEGRWLWLYRLYAPVS